MQNQLWALLWQCVCMRAGVWSSTPGPAPLCGNPPPLPPGLRKSQVKQLPMAEITSRTNRTGLQLQAQLSYKQSQLFTSIIQPFFPTALGSQTCLLAIWTTTAAVQQTRVSRVGVLGQRHACARGCEGEGHGIPKVNVRGQKLGQRRLKGDLAGRQLMEWLTVSKSSGRGGSLSEEDNKRRLAGK